MTLEDIKGLGHIKVSHLNSGVVKIATEDGYWLLSGHTFSKELYARVDSTFLDYTIVTSEEKNKTENSSKYEGKTLEEAKEMLLAEIVAYDTSSAVNSFILNGVPRWLNLDKRQSIAYSAKILKEKGHDSITIWFDTDKVVLPIDDAISLLDTLEVYAKTTNNVTHEHMLTVDLLSDIEEVHNFDVTAGYPRKVDY